ncbi:ankyrin [Corynespora cassiicola Philippines]|uniref:Ankyrin n=1 Tax=Corynespora cassiicola Philippines TaxID=1448308 RepID=A0A2T2NXG5_CORCC|nr:ankyrin [Corynespora cassiicola Philippines]
MSPSVLPQVPVKHAHFLDYIQNNPSKSLPELLEPYKQYDAKLREVFAQETDHPALADDHLNIVPVFNGKQHHVTIHARDLASESHEEKERYVMPLGASDRRPNGSPAIVQDIKDFQKNFALFCESSLVDLDWSNVVAAGSSVVTCMLPVPAKCKNSKRALRQYYHETIAPASDVDLFLYGLSEEDAVKKIIEIERRIKDSILTETTTIRTKNAITIASQYPTRHIQIVLRIYKSVSEILTGFDVDCSCAAYDGKQVWAAPRALTAYMTQTNTIDLTRRSPSYENRLSKYSHRGFEVYWPLLDRSRIDPTIFERNFARTVGLARLLVLERLPTKSEREQYMDQRRRERGRPEINRGWRRYDRGGDNIKEQYEDEVADWMVDIDQQDVSDYHTFTIPYGEKYHAKKIEKLLYTKDLLLNAEWNKRDDREVNLHRHPAFFGFAEDVIHDCCGVCPEPATLEEEEVAEAEAKIYVSGEISFIKDDPGRQAIGSFNPITDDDWTEMAYVGNTARLCQAIVDEDLEHVQDWLAQEGSDPNCRDYTGRTPLHLAVTSSTPEIVKTLIDHGARLVARLADGRTSLHLAASRGNVEIVRMILQKSEENEEEEAKKEDARKQTRIDAKKASQQDDKVDMALPERFPSDSASDIEVIDQEDSDDEAHSTTTGSYIKIKEQDNKEEGPALEDNQDDPDVFDINVLAWDTQCSALHYAILNGHIDVVKELVQTFGADVLLPIKLLNQDKSPRGAILTLVLSLRLPLEKARAMTKTLLELGASSAQADTKQTTALHYISDEQPELLETLFEFDEPSAKRAINHLAVTGWAYNPGAQSPLMSAILRGNAAGALKLLEAGALPCIEFKDWMKSVEATYEDIAKRDSKQNYETFLENVEPPIISAVAAELPGVVQQLLERGASPNTLTKAAQECIFSKYRRSYQKSESLLDIVRAKIEHLKDFKDDEPPKKPEQKFKEDVGYLEGIDKGSYKYFIARMQINCVKKSDKQSWENYKQQLKTYEEREGVVEKMRAVAALRTDFEKLEELLLSKGAKTCDELHPELKVPESTPSDSHKRSNRPWEWDMPPWSVEFDFQVHDLTDETRDAYLRLFQAAWDGDLDTVKALTLATWGLNNDNTPLKIAVSDRHDHSPFTLSVLRGHHEVAKAILEISFAQYHPIDEEPKARYYMEPKDEDEDDSSYGGDVPVYKEIIDDKFTIDNIGEISTQVKSRITPLQYITWRCKAWHYAYYFMPDRKFTYGPNNKEISGSGTVSLVNWSIITNDKSLFSFLLDLQLEWVDRMVKKEEKGTSTIPSFDYADYSSAMKYSRLEHLAEMIKHGGAGMELEALVNKSGVKYQEKPKYYQGLSVHGKKRNDWVSAARGEYVRSVVDRNPPLLEAAFKGSLGSVEWYLSDTPTRHYLDFAEAYKDDKLIKHLNTKGGGFEKVLRKWLGARRELALHCAVMATPTDESQKLIEYLIKTIPDSLEHKSNDGYTPLALAFARHHYDAAKLLIAVGANQTVRDYEGANIIHLLLVSPYYSSTANSDKLQPMLNLIDERLVPSLLTERSSHHPGSLTPINRWLHRSTEDTKTFKILLDFAAVTNNEWLELMDGAGETPLHYAIKEKSCDWVKQILQTRPDLLYRENSVGRTPYELAADSYLANCVQSAPSIVSLHTRMSSITDRHRSAFLKREADEEDERRDFKSIWGVCNWYVQEHPGKRRLVSLLDANEVANRLAGRKTSRVYGEYDEQGSDVESDSGDAGEDFRDEVRQWY